MVLPKINKIKEVIGHKFRIIKQGFTSVQSGYEHWLAKKTKVICRYTDATETAIERYDKTSKSWVADDKKFYWYEDEKTGKNRNYLSDYQSFTIEFEKPASLGVYNSETRINGPDIVKKAFLELRGNESFGTAKKIHEAIDNASSLGKDKNEVWMKMEQDGIGYKFTMSGVVDDEVLKAENAASEEGQKDELINNAVEEFKKDDSLSKQDIMSALINTYGIEAIVAQEILEKNFSDRE